MRGAPINVLFLCTGNSARSILAEALLERFGAPRFKSFSAGSDPKPAPHPVALETLVDKGYDVGGFRSKSWEEFASDGAPALDLIITVCDNAAAEVCPVWPGHPATAHWGHPDPAAVVESAEKCRAAFEEVYTDLMTKICALVALADEELEADKFEQRVRAIAH